MHVIVGHFIHFQWQLEMDYVQTNSHTGNVQIRQPSNEKDQEYPCWRQKTTGFCCDALHVNVDEQVIGYLWTLFQSHMYRVTWGTAVYVCLCVCMCL